MNILVIARTKKDLSLLDKAAARSPARLILASDDLEIHRLARKDPRVQDIRFLDQMFSVFKVMDKVEVIVELVNTWLRENTTEVPAYLVELNRHTEGGRTTQAIQDMLLIIESARYLLKETDVRVLLMNRHANTHFEDEIWIQTAHSLGIAVEAESGPFLSLMLRLRPYIIKTHLLGAIRSIVLPERVAFFVRRLRFFLLQTARYFGALLDKPIGPDVPLAVFQLGSSNNSHVENIVPLMNELSRRGTCLPLALCWQAGNGRKSVSKRGLHARNVERWTPWLALPRMIRMHRRIRHRLSKMTSALQQSRELVYQGVPLFSFLIPSLKHLLEEDLLYRVILEGCIDRFVRRHRIVSMKVWGSYWLDWGKIGFETLKKHRPSAVAFDYPLGISGPFPWDRLPASKLDLYFAQGETDRVFLKRETTSTEIFVTGYPRNQLLSEFQNISKKESLKELGLGEDGRLAVLFASSNVIQGYYSILESLRLLDAIISAARENKELLLLIKPHPSEDVSGMNQIFEQYGRPANVVILSKAISIYHCINASDVVVAKYSTVMLEAMRLRKWVVSLALDGEPKFQDIFEDSVPKFQDIQPLLDFFKLISKTTDQSAAFKDQQLKKQDIYLEKKIFQPREPVESVIAGLLLSRLPDNLGK